ncbi:MAG: acylneuraminate cytidylyltransferase family protein [Solirubrobacteraceae bacterium]
MSTGAVALIPARGGSKRVPGKNVRPLAGHPLIAYSISAARESGAFDAVVVSTDDERTAEIAEHYGAEVPALRPPELATTTSPDIDWIEHMLQVMERSGSSFELFAILRPTSPFRSGATIRAGSERLRGLGESIHSVRAVEPCRQHPGKMWLVHGDDLMTPLLLQPEELPFHSRQYQALPEVYVQSSSLELAWTRVVRAGRTIAGRRVAPLLVAGNEGFSIDYPDDWHAAERLLESGEARLPQVHVSPFAGAGAGAGL